MSVNPISIARALITLLHFYLRLLHSPGGENWFNFEFDYKLEFDSIMFCQSIHIAMANNSTHSIYRPIDMRASQFNWIEKYIKIISLPIFISRMWRAVTI